MSRQGEKVRADCFGLPTRFFVSWSRCNRGDGIRWTLWDGDTKVADFALGDAIDRLALRESFSENARQMFWDLAEEYLAREWDERIDAARPHRALPPKPPVLLPEHHTGA